MLRVNLAVSCNTANTGSWLDVGLLMQIALFAGRRSSDRAYLLLQTLFCAHHLKPYIGTSSIYAVIHLDEALTSEGVKDPQERKSQIGTSQAMGSWLRVPEA